MPGQDSPLHGAQSRCLFLDTMPAELRVMVYESLALNPEPITALPNAQSPSLDLALLRANRQIHDEAAAVFYSKNTITLRPGARGSKLLCTGIPAEKYRHLVRHLRAEGLCRPASPGQTWARKQGGLGEDEEHNGVRANEEYSTSMCPHPDPDPKLEHD